MILDRCPCCDCADHELVFEGGTARQPQAGHRWRLVACQDCQLAYLNPQPSWSGLQPFYDHSYPAYSSSHGAADDDDVVVATAEREGSFRHLPVPRGKKVLDVGTGGGYFLRICKKLGAETFGVDPSVEAVATARAQGLDIFHGTIHDFQHAGQFDVITANQVLEHTPDPVIVLRKMRSLVADDGVIWISVPNFGCVWSRLLGWRWDGADLPYHLVHFGAESLARAGNKAGLRVRVMRTHSDRAIVKYSARKVLRHRFGIPERLGRAIVSDRWAGSYAAKLDRAGGGDTLIVEFVPE